MKWNFLDTMELTCQFKNFSYIFFDDSLSLAYGCAAYFRLAENNKAKVSFVIGNRLALLKGKFLSIPKSELQAALTSTMYIYIYIYIYMYKASLLDHLWPLI